MSAFTRRAGSVALLALSAMGGACGGGSGDGGDGFLIAPGTVFASTITNDLVTFLSTAPSAPFLSSTPITGLQPGETIAGMDFRSGTGDLLALGSTGQLYRIDPSSAAATQLGAGPFAVLAGSFFGFDIDPDTDQIRVVSDMDENLRAAAATGAFLGSDATLVYGAGDANFGANPTVVGLAYTVDSAGATTATAYGIDASLDTLVRVGGLGGAPPATSGILSTVGSLGVDTSAILAFDIAGGSGRAYAALTTPASQLYRIDLGTGAASFVGAIGPVVTTVTAMAVIAEQFPTLLALTSSGNLVTFRANTPGTILSSVPVSGLLLPGELLVGIDLRPATGQLYGVSTASRLYRIDRTTGVATAVGAPAQFLLVGTEFALDFDPVLDVLRVVSDANQNLRIDPDDGTLAGTDSALAYSAVDPNLGADPNVVGAAYTNSFPSSPSTQLFGIDSNLDILVRQDPPNDGVLHTVGPFGFDTTGLVGFDIAGATGEAYASLTAPAASASGLFRVSLGTGVVSLLGSIGAGSTIEGLVVLTDGATTGTDAETIFVVDALQNLLRVRADNPSVALSNVPITGLQLGELVEGIDVRPATGELYVLGSLSRLYTVDPSSGVATAVGLPGAFVLSGTNFGLDFDPITDVVRVTSDADQNLRLSAAGGLISDDTALAYSGVDANAGADPNVSASAYTGNSGTPDTLLYGIDATLNLLVTQSPADAGMLNTVGALGVTLTAGLPVGFDIAPPVGRSYVSATVLAEVTSRLFVVNRGTGALTSVGALAGASPIRAIAVDR